MPLFGGRDFKKIFFFNYSFILAVLGLRWCMGFSLVAASGGYSLGAVEGLLPAVVLSLWSVGSGVVAPGLHSTGSTVVARALSCSEAWSIFQDYGWNPFPCIGRRILYLTELPGKPRDSYFKEVTKAK